MQDFYGPISEANILAFMAVFVNHPDANVRSKACNALGNMCRHTPHFYKEMVGVSNHNTCILLFTLAVDSLRKYTSARQYSLVSHMVVYCRSDMTLSTCSLIDVQIQIGEQENLHALR